MNLNKSSFFLTSKMKKVLKIKTNLSDENDFFLVHLKKKYTRSLIQNYKDFIRFTFFKKGRRFNFVTLYIEWKKDCFTRQD